MTYVPPEKNDNIKCNFLNCYAGGGLAGRGICFLEGEPFNSKCPEFQDEREINDKWEREECR